ncbi:ATP-binding protein [Marinobacteraceae bacterium S3BR75-40.1]
MQLKIRHKLFLVLLAANLLVALAIFISISWNFSRSFQDYLRQTRLEQLSPLVNGLAQDYASHGQSWRWLRHNHRQWAAVLQRHLGLEVGKPPAATPRPGPPPQEKVPPFARGLLLQDQQGRMVLGPPDAARDHPVQWIDIPLDGNTVGQLGLPQQFQLSRDMDRLFVSRLLSQSAWIVLAVLLLSACLAFPFARRLVRPVTRLQGAMAQLAGGAIEKVRPLPVEGHDELAKLAQAFNLLTETLRQNQQARQQWVADISHELRTPIAVLRGELEALIDGVRPLEPQAVESLHAEIMRLTRLVEDLNELSLSDMGALSYRREPLSLKALLEDLLAADRPRLEAQGLALETHLPSVPDQIFADADRLTQLFRNLLNNSLRYTAEGGRIRVRMTVDRKSQTIIVVWEDSAPGVEDQDLEKLFERLYRTDSARDRISGGFGLGLAICRAIVEAHQGHIDAVHSELGGLAVRVHLPLYR